MRWCDAVASHGLNVAFNFIIIAVDFSSPMADFSLSFSLPLYFLRASHKRELRGNAQQSFVKK